MRANFEAPLRSEQATASASVRLYNATDNEAVTSSAVSVSGTTFAIQRSSNLTIGASAGNLKSSKDYVVQLSYESGVETQVVSAKLLISQTAAGGLTAMQLVHQHVNTKITDTDSTYTDQDFLNQYNPSNFVGGTFTYYFESTLKTSAGTGYAKLKNDSDTDEIDNPTTSEVTTTDNDYVRVRSSALGSNSDWPTAAKNMDTIAKNSAASGNTTSISSSWLIIEISNLQIPENLLIFIPVIVFIPALLRWRERWQLERRMVCSFSPCRSA